MTASKGKNWAWYRDLMAVLVQKELTTRYKRSLLGVFWSILNPMANAYVFYIVFGVFMRMNVPHFIVVLLAAMFPWQCFNNSVFQGTDAFISNPTLVKKVAFPRQAIPLVIVLQNLVHLLLSFPIFLLFMFWEGLYPGLIWVWAIPLLLFLTLVTSYGMGLLLGTINVFFRDLSNLVGILMQVAFFATPIMYVITIVPEQYLWVFKANPAAPLFICWRSVLAYNELDWDWLAFASVYALFFLVFGFFVFRKLQYRFAEVI